MMGQRPSLTRCFGTPNASKQNQVQSTLHLVLSTSAPRLGDTHHLSNRCDETRAQGRFDWLGTWARIKTKRAPHDVLSIN
ncbi:hypothetical protein Z946_3798 [Sulfitobacter noctilucicola]|nr:hypothetical protein Z946_3798 [Sulfitobacter noctilucicola]